MENFGIWQWNLMFQSQCSMRSWDIGNYLIVSQLIDWRSIDLMQCSSKSLFLITNGTSSSLLMPTVEERTIVLLVTNTQCVVYYTYTYTNTNTKRKRKQADSVFQVQMVLLTSDFSFLTRGERHNSYYANHPQCAVHLVMFKISLGRDLKNPTTSLTAQIQLSTDSFPKSSNSQDHLLQAWRHPHSSPISWWLSYPLRMSVKPYPMTKHLNS